MASLPTELVMMVAKLLGEDKEFDALFNLALTGTQMVNHALISLYRNLDLQLVEQVGSAALRRRLTSLSNLDLQLIEQVGSTALGQRPTSQIPKERRAAVTADMVFASKAIQWRSIILSTIGKTYLPYAYYLQTLHLGSLEEFFQDYVSKRDAYEQFFFAGDMVIWREHKSDLAEHTRSPVMHDTICDIGETVTKFVSDYAESNRGTVAITEFHGYMNIPGEILPSWFARLTRLREINLWQGDVLGKLAGEAVAQHCPSFERLNLMYCTSSGTDQTVAEFLQTITQHTLRSFRMNSLNHVGQETFDALDKHSGSLTELKIHNLETSAVCCLGRLRRCTLIEKLDLQDHKSSLRLETSKPKEYTQVEEWFCDLSSLKEISLDHFLDGHKLLTAVCLSDNIKLRSLKLRVEKVLTTDMNLYTALSHQTTLEHLEIIGELGDLLPSIDLDSAVHSLCQLVALKHLKFTGVADWFEDEHIRSIAESLTNLEYLAIGGFEISDHVWPFLRMLKFLRHLTFAASTCFTYDGILGFVRSLGPTNKEFQLSIMSALPGSECTERQQKTISRELANRVGGRFDFGMLRDSDEEDLGSESFSD